MSPKFINESSTGVINGLILCINSFTFGSLLVSHYSANLVGVAVGAMLISGIFGSLYGILSKDKSLTCGPSGTVASIMAGPTLIFFSGSNLTAETFIFPIVLLGLLVALIFYFTAKLGVANLFKFIPYSVFLGLMAATGYLISKGALSIILGEALEGDFHGINFYDLVGPQLLISVSIAFIYLYLTPRISAQILIPSVFFIFTIAITFFLGSELCAGEICDRSKWFFTVKSTVNWSPSWLANPEGLTLIKLLEFIPTVVSVAFICVLSILVSFENLYIWFGQEFDTREELKKHSILIALSTFFGGFIPNLAFQRVVLNKTIGAALGGGIITACIAFIAFFYIDQIIELAPRCVIAGFLLFQGLEVIQKSFSNRRKLTRIDLALASFILLLVALHSFVYGFIVGLILSFLYSIYSLSRIPLVDKLCDLADLRSFIIRPHNHENMLMAGGKKIKYLELDGYLFYGTITQLDGILANLDFSNLNGIVIDASKVIGFDTSAKITLGRILARYHQEKLKWYIISDIEFSEGLRDVISKEILEKSIIFFKELNPALEDIEESILQSKSPLADSDCLEFLTDESDKRDFRTYCESLNISQNGVYLLDPLAYRDLLFVSKGQCSIEIQTTESNRIVAKAFPGALIGDLDQLSETGSKIIIHAQTELVLLKLSEASIERMKSERPDLCNQLNEFLITVLKGYLLSAKKLVSSYV